MIQKIAWIVAVCIWITSCTSQNMTENEAITSSNTTT